MRPSYFLVLSLATTPFIAGWIPVRALAEDQSTKMIGRGRNEVGDFDKPRARSMQILSSRNSEDMHEQVRIDDLPEYPHKTKWITGTKFGIQRWLDAPGQPPSGVCYDMTVSCKEKPEDVIAWYKQALKANSWKLLSKELEERISAKSEDGKLLAVTVSKADLPKDHDTWIHIVYRPE